MATPVLTSIYPDVDPSKGLPLTRGERFAQSCTLAVFSYGFTQGDLILAGGGLLLLLVAAIAPGRKTARRIRSEARARFPSADWAENKNHNRLLLGAVLVLSWVAIIALNIAAFRYSPADYQRNISIATAIISGLLLWLSTTSFRKRQRTVD